MREMKSRVCSWDWFAKKANMLLMLSQTCEFSATNDKAMTSTVLEVFQPNY